MLSGLILAFVCAIGWAGLDAFRKLLSAGIAPIPLLVLLNVGLLPVFLAWWLLAGGSITSVEGYALPGGLGVALQVVANVLFLAAVRVSPLSLTIPFLALTPVFAALIGVVTLGERPEATQLAGIGLVVIGALALGSSESSEAGEGGRGRLLQVFAREPGAWMMTGVALCWGISTALDKLALAHAAVPIHALIQLSGVIVVALVYLVIRGRVPELATPLRRGASPRRQLLWLALATATGAVAFGVQLLAIQYVFVSVLETIKRGVGLVSSIALGRLVFGESITAAKVVAVLAMVLGVVLLMSGETG